MCYNDFRKRHIFRDFMPFHKGVFMKLRKGRAFGALAVVTALAVCGVGCAMGRSVGKANTEAQTSSENTAATTPEETTEEQTTLPPDKVVHVVAAGDNLIHYSVFKNAEALAGGSGYDFKPMYSEVK